MTFEDCQKKLKFWGFYTPLMQDICKQVWNAATAAERQRCREIAEKKASFCLRAECCEERFGFDACKDIADEIGE